MWAKYWALPGAVSYFLRIFAPAKRRQLCCVLTQTQHNTGMKRILTLLAVALLATSCGRSREEVLLTYPNGQPRLVVTVKGKDDKKVRVGEKLFYENGELRAQKHFSGNEETPSGTWEYHYMNGKIFAKGNFNKDHVFGTEWRFNNPDGSELYAEHADSLKVVEMTENQMPGTVYYYSADSIRVFQFFEDFTLRSTGTIRHKLLDGRWKYFYPNGTLQLEALYIEGKENGLYCSYRESGIPYFRGMYINGVRAGRWEFYDDQGNLSGTKNFDE